MVPPPLVFGSEALPAGTVRISRVKGQERVSGLFEAVIDVQEAQDKDAFEDAMAALLDQPAYFGREGAAPMVRGILRDVELHDATAVDPPVYRLTLVPRLWRTTLTRRCRIFQALTVPEIVQAVLQAQGFVPADWVFRLAAAYAKREYVVQYEESDYNLIARLCEDEGIYFWFEHGGNVDVVVFGDRNTAGRKVPENDGLAFQTRSDQSSITRLRRRVQRVQANAELLDYNWRTPTITLDSEARVAGGTTGTWTETQTHYRDKTTGDRFAAVRAEEIGATRVVYSGESGVESLRGGDQMSLHGHFVATLDKSYFVVGVEYECDQQVVRSGQVTTNNAFTNRFVAVELATQYRPQRLTPKPVVAGCIYATIDGPDVGAAAPIDDQGRYKVILPFDTTLKGTGKATRWIRMTQPLSGGGYGLHFPLRAGAEVALVHVNGDPDRPIITGSIPNAVTPSPVQQRNATQNVIQTHTGIRVEMEDNAT